MRFITKLLGVGALGLGMALATAAAASASPTTSPVNGNYVQECGSSAVPAVTSYDPGDKGQNPCCPQYTNKPDGYQQGGQSQDPPPGDNSGQGQSQCCPQEKGGQPIWDRNNDQCCLQDHGQPGDNYWSQDRPDGCYQPKPPPCQPKPKPCQPKPAPCHPKHHKHECKPKHHKKHHHKKHPQGPVSYGKA